MSLFRGHTQWHGNRRSILKGGTLGGIGLAVAAGLDCGGGTRQAPPVSGAARTATSQATQPRRGGTLIDARFLVLTGKSLDPDVDPPTSNKMRRLWYQGLLGYNLRTLAIEPQLAQKWEQPSPTEYVFTLQPGVKWHNKSPVNGREFTMDDVVYGLNRVRTNDPRFINRSLLDPIDQIQPVNASSLKITTKHPYAVFLQTLASDGVLFVAPEAATKFGNTFATAESVVGTGAFIMRTWQDNIGAESVRNPDYWKAGLPYLDGFNYRFFGDSQEAYAALLADQVHLIGLTGNQAKDYIPRQGSGFKPQLGKPDALGTDWLMPNVRNAPFNDARVTRALKLLTDYQELLSANGKVFLVDAEYGAVLPTSLDEWDFTNDEYSKMIFWQQPKDAAVKEALTLLQAAGYGKDKPLRFETHVQTNSGDPQPPNLAQLIQAQWRKFGQGAVDTDIKILDGPTAQKEQAQSSFPYGLLNGAGAFSDPDPWFVQLFHTGGSRNYTGFGDSEIDGLIDQQGAIFDRNQRKVTVKQIVQLLIDRCPQTMPFRAFELNGVNKRVQGYTPDGGVTQGRQFEQVWLSS